MAKETKDIDEGLAQRKKALADQDSPTQPVERPQQEGAVNYGPQDADRVPGRHLPSVYVNRFHFLMGDDVTRLVFGQSVVGEVPGNWHLAVTMPTSDAIALAEALLEIADSRRKEAEANAGSST